MSVTIDNNLVVFKQKIEPAIGTASSMITTLTSKLGELNDKSRTAVTDLNASYQGNGLTTAINAFNSINAAVEGIKASFAEGPETVFSLSSALIKDITELEKLKEAIDALEGELSELGGKRSYNAEKTNKAEVDAHNAKIDQKQAEKEEKEAEFDVKQEACLSQLSAIKGIDPSIDITVKTPAVEYTGNLLEDIKNMTPGTYNEYTYTGKNGETIKTYIYIPANASTTEGLPVHLYMGGTGERGNANAGGLAKLLTEGKQASGIVIVLEAKSYSSYRTGSYIDTAIELTDNIVTTYKADPNRISVSGHSLGGIGAICFAERYPNYFSVCAPVSGYNYDTGRNSSSREEAYSKLRNVNIVAVSGKSDTDSYNSMVGLYNAIKDAGNMQFIPVSGGHKIQYKMYDEPVEVNGQTYSNWLEFCLAQSKSTATIAS